MSPWSQIAPNNQSGGLRPNGCRQGGTCQGGKPAGATGSKCGCSCGSGSTDRAAACPDRLLAEIQEVDFALYEAVLYLDAYPDACDALELYHQLKARREELHAAYEAAVGPLTPFGNQKKTSWDWIEGPFPWEYKA